MSDDPICKLCGHPASSHGIVGDDLLCVDCPERICQDGPDGERYRDSL